MNPQAEVKIMIRARIICIAALLALAVTPATAADRPQNSPTYIDATAPAAAAAPFYVVNQGPELSGPGIMITEIGVTRTGVRRSYPFIGTYDDLTRVVAWRDYYGVMPANYAPAVKVGPRPRARARYVVRAKVSHRKPAKVQRAR